MTSEEEASDCSSTSSQFSIFAPINDSLKQSFGAPHLSSAPKGWIWVLQL